MLQGLFDIAEKSSEATKKVYHVKVNAAHDVFKGHFPDQPVLPGVAMVYLSRFLTQCVYESRVLTLKESSQIKFLSLIDPRNTPEFTYTNDIVKEADGVVYVKGEIKHNDTTFFKISASYH